MKNDLYTKEKKYIYFISLTILLFLSLIQALFYFIQYSSLDSALKGIKGILRSDVINYNTYNISKSIRDLEHLELLECSILKTPKLKNSAYLDLTFNKNCNSNIIFLNGINATKILSLSNGDEWEISFKSVNNKGFYYSLWLTRFLSILFILILIKLYIERVEKKNYIIKMKIKHAEGVKRIARQVSHDIRSPLAAISISVNDMTDLSDPSKLILKTAIQRIHDIANNLLNTTNPAIKSLDDKVEKTHLYSSINEIIQEKQTLYKFKKNLHIYGDLDNGKKLFSKINNAQFKRILSNLINNSQEALISDKGFITITLFKKHDRAYIKITDNGKGIPPEILSNLGGEGVSFGKEGLKGSGSGIGLNHAVMMIKKWGGKLSIDSCIESGTTISIQLPLIVKKL